MTIYDEMQKIAGDLLSEFRQGVIQHVKVTPGNGPADNPGPSTIAAPVTIPGGTVRGVSFKYVKDSLALATDLTVILPVVAGMDIAMRDFIDIDGVRFKIVHDISPPAAGTRVVRKFIVRKGA